MITNRLLLVVFIYMQWQYSTAQHPESVLDIYPCSTSPTDTAVTPTTVPHAYCETKFQCKNRTRKFPFCGRGHNAVEVVEVCSCSGTTSVINPSSTYDMSSSELDDMYSFSFSESGSYSSINSESCFYSTEPTSAAVTPTTLPPTDACCETKFLCKNRVKKFPFCGRGHNAVEVVEVCNCSETTSVVTVPPTDACCETKFLCKNRARKFPFCGRGHNAVEAVEVCSCSETTTAVTPTTVPPTDACCETKFQCKNRVKKFPFCGRGHNAVEVVEVCSCSENTASTSEIPTVAPTKCRSVSRITLLTTKTRDCFPKLSCETTYVTYFGIRFPATTCTTKQNCVYRIAVKPETVQMVRCY